MGYVAVKGGTEAIEESLRRLQYERLKNETVLQVKDVEGGMMGLIDQVMSEASLYCSSLAALAIKQAEGNPEEAVFLLRAYRSTLPRLHYSEPMETENMFVERRISASFKDIPGGQILGASPDFSHRLLDFKLTEETMEEVFNWLHEYERDQQDSPSVEQPLKKLPKVVDYLRQEGLLQEVAPNDEQPDDITRESLQFPASRSARLQSLTRGQTGAVTSLAYAALRGYGALHPTVGELRVGKAPIYIGVNEVNDESEQYYIGDVQVTEVESFIPITIEKPGGKNELQFELGYGICFGQNETKAISMSLLDHCLETGDPRYPTNNEEFVLLHIDSVESTGFISHLKLPHYVTFQSELDRVRKTKTNQSEDLTEESVQ
ncbi:carbon-phosphorus lyase [Bacillaceae bacterium SAOS 7]|nr:carbon-phosphorus lyase [Bacillaceae bacterium SAOS 7]